MQKVEVTMEFHARPLWWKYLLRSGRGNMLRSRSRFTRRRRYIPHNNPSTGIPHSNPSMGIPHSLLYSASRCIRSTRRIPGPYNASNRCMGEVHKVRSGLRPAGDSRRNSGRSIHNRVSVSSDRWMRTVQQPKINALRLRPRLFPDQRRLMTGCPAVVMAKTVMHRVPGHMRELIQDTTARRPTVVYPGAIPEPRIRAQFTREGGEARG